MAAASVHIAPWGAHAINVTEPAAFNTLLLGFLDALPRVESISYAHRITSP
jgi:hypothetical protein